MYRSTEHDFRVIGGCLKFLHTVQCTYNRCARDSDELDEQISTSK